MVPVHCIVCMLCSSYVDWGRLLKIWLVVRVVSLLQIVFRTVARTFSQKTLLLALYNLFWRLCFLKNHSLPGGHKSSACSRKCLLLVWSSAKLLRLLHRQTHTYIVLRQLITRQERPLNRKVLSITERILASIKRISDWSETVTIIRSHSFLRWSSYLQGFFQKRWVWESSISEWNVFVLDV